jgi:RNase P/RNase MRP subunit POP5
MTRRYLLVKVLYSRELTDQQFHDTLNSSIRTHFGDIGFSRIDPKIIRFNQSTSTSIVSCERSAVKELASALALITDSGGTTIAVLVLAASGTIKGLRKRKVG